MALNLDDVELAALRIADVVRPVAMFGAGEQNRWYAAEFMQHTGSFKARGAANFPAAHLASGKVPDAGVTIASGGNAGLACAWAAQMFGIVATVFVPGNAPRVKIDRLRGLGAKVELVGTEYAHAAEKAERFAAETGALASHAYDHPLIAAGAGTLMREIVAQAMGGLDTDIVAVGGGGLLAGVATVAAAHGIGVVAVEPRGCSAYAAAAAAGSPVDVTVDSVAADALGARRVTQLALDAAAPGHVRSVLVDDAAIVSARRALWDGQRLAIEHAAAAPLATLTSGAYQPRTAERIVLILCGANTDPATWPTNLSRPADRRSESGKRCRPLRSRASWAEATGSGTREAQLPVPLRTIRPR